MPQMHFPIFPNDVTTITSHISFKKEDGKIVYFDWQMPIFTHDEDDFRSFRMFTSQLCVNGNAKQVDIIRAFGVTKNSVLRAVKLFKEKGPPGFYAKKKGRGASVLALGVLEKAQQLLDQGMDRTGVARELNIKSNTISKAVGDGRLHEVKKKECPNSQSSTKSERSIEDDKALMGVGTTNKLDRIAASLGDLEEVGVNFETILDVGFGGVLLAIPALLSIGLLRDSDHYFQLPKGYYGLDSIFLLLAFMALGRVKTIESLRSHAPGEWGKLLGLDRIPEIKTLREKINLLSSCDTSASWMSALSSYWMDSEPEISGILYVDGHVRVYNGKRTKLPRQYVARNKLCLRATMDYWVNAMDGQPFFKVTQEVNPGLLKVLENEIVPRLEETVPSQPTVIELLTDIYVHRFTIVFDREGYSPDFFSKMKEKRIACITYHKFPGNDWPEDEFRSQKVVLKGGHVVEMNLAERGTKLSNGLWVREVRKLTRNHHQTSVISTDYTSDLLSVSVAMFSRWSQENFFRYMRQNYNLDSLIDYKLEEIDGTKLVVNPKHREIDGQVRSKIGILNRRLKEFSVISFKKEIDPKKIEKYQQKKAELKEEIEELQLEVNNLKKERKETRRHIRISELPEEDRFKKLNTKSKYFIDTIKMIAYRAETAMSNILREKMSRPEEVRSLLKVLYSNEANIYPDETEGTLTVELHHFVNRKDDISIIQLCDELNETETIFPGTNMRMVYKLVSQHNQ